MSRVVASPPFSLRPLVLGLPVLVACFAVDAEEAVELEAQQITAPRAVEQGNGPVEGYVAKRSIGATKTDTPIVETPQSISVITADRIRDQGSLTIQDSLRYVAGMRGEAYGLDSRGDFALIRGVAPTLFLDGLQQSVGFYTNSRTDPFTLERVEVIKGPSSMLYGQSSVGGLLNFVSKRPQAEQKSELQLQYGSFDRKQIAFDSTGPLDEDGTLLYRVVAIQRDSQTQVDHTKDNRLVFMPSLTWRPNEQFEWTLMANVQKDDSGTTSSFLPHRGTVLSAPYGEIGSERFVSEPGFDEYDAEQKALTSQMAWRVDDTWTLRQNLRWQKSKVSYQTMYGASIPARCSTPRWSVSTTGTPSPIARPPAEPPPRWISTIRCTAPSTHPALRFPMSRSSALRSRASMFRTRSVSTSGWQLWACARTGPTPASSRAPGRRTML